MAMIEYDEYKQKLTAMGPELDKLAAALDMDRARGRAQVHLGGPDGAGGILERPGHLPEGVPADQAAGEQSPRL